MESATSASFPTLQKPISSKASWASTKFVSALVHPALTCALNITCNQRCHLYTMLVIFVTTIHHDPDYCSINSESKACGRGGGRKSCALDASSSRVSNVTAQIHRRRNVAHRTALCPPGIRTVVESLEKRFQPAVCSSLISASPPFESWFQRTPGRGCEVRASVHDHFSPLRAESEVVFLAPRWSQNGPSKAAGIPEGKEREMRRKIQSDQLHCRLRKRLRGGGDFISLGKLHTFGCDDVERNREGRHGLLP